MTRGRLSREEARTRTREAILDEARAMFGARGYRGATLSDIAEAAGFSKGAVYSNWPSKEALFLDLLDRQSREEMTDGTGPRRPDLEPSIWALATLEFFLEAVHHPKIRSALAEHYRQTRTTLAAALTRERPDASWATGSEIASITMAVGTGLIIQAAIDPTAIDPTLFARLMDRLRD
jgi:AcrR family transcriptional regulator